MRCFGLREKCNPNQVSVLLVLVGAVILLPGGGLALGDEVQTMSELPWYLDPSLFPGGTLFPGNQQYSYAPDIMGFAFNDLYMDIVWLHPLLGEDAIKVYAVQGGDFNEDGKLDLIVDVGKRRVGACERGERVHELYLLLNQGGGDFTVAPGYPLVWGCVLSHQPSLFTTADLNQDGHLDVVGVDTDDNYLLLLFGDGRGELELVRQEVPLEVEPENPGFGGVSIGDFNEDGYPDIVISSLYGLVPVMNDGRGRFVRSSDVIVLQEPWPEYGTVGPAAPTSAGAVSDFDRDGHLDVAFPHVAAEHFGFWYSILYGDGRGEFEVVSYPGYTVSGTVTSFVGDFNEDGWPDLVGLPIIACPYILYNQGQRTFRLQPLGPGCWGGPIWEEGDGQHLVGDFNGDGHLDIAFFYAGSKIYAPTWFPFPKGYYMFILLGNGQGDFGLAWLAQIPRLYSVPCFVGDLNSDGVDDLVLGGQPYPGEKRILTLFLSKLRGQDGRSGK